MASRETYKVVPIKPLTGLLDVRSRPDLMAPGTMRFRQNFNSPEDLKLCRRAGWEKLLSSDTYNNQDLHDQLLALQQYYNNFIPEAAGADNVIAYPSNLCDGAIQTRSNGREYITYLVELVSSSGFRKLVACTQSRIYELNERSGNWRILADGMGGSVDSNLSVRFQSAQVKDTVMFTNNVDQPVVYQMFASIQGCDMRATTRVPDFDAIFLSKAKCVCAYKNIMFLANVEMDGQRLQNRIIWSDNNKPTSWDPAVTEITGTISSSLSGNVLSWNNPAGLEYLIQSRPSALDPWEEVDFSSGESLIVADTALQYRVVSFVSSTIAGFQDLSYGHVILGMIVLGDYLVILTDRGIWQMTPSNNGDGPAFSFRCAYESQVGDKCLTYPNTLTSIGGSLFWLSRDGAYLYNFFQDEPERVEWMHRATGIIYDGVASQARINDLCCESHVATYRPVEKEIWISWAVEGSCIPSATMVINVKQKFIDTVDAGFTCFTNYRSDSRGSLRDFMLDYCICTTESLVQNGIQFLKEGLPLPGAAADCDETPDSLYTTETRNIGGNPANGVMEDYDADPSPLSLCSILGDRSFDDLCRDCNQDQLFVGADVADRCLKQIGTSYNRERCTNPTAVGTIYVDADGIATYQSSTGIYRLDGYYSVMRFQPLSFGLDDIKKMLRRIAISFESVPQAYPCIVQVRVGVSYSVEDPNYGTTTNPNDSQNAESGCGVIWKTVLRKRLTCLNGLTPAQYAAQNLVPNMDMEWALLLSANWLYFEVVIANLVDQDNINSELAPTTGGQSCFSSVSSWVAQRTLDR